MSFNNALDEYHRLREEAYRLGLPMVSGADDLHGSARMIRAGTNLLLSAARQGENDPDRQEIARRLAEAAILLVLAAVEDSDIRLRNHGLLG